MIQQDVLIICTFWPYLAVLYAGGPTTTLRKSPYSFGVVILLCWPVFMCTSEFGKSRLLSLSLSNKMDRAYITYLVQKAKPKNGTGLVGWHNQKNNSSI